MSVNRVFLFGYEGRQPSDLLAACQRFDAKLVDVRYSPRSRNAAWSGRSLAALFGDRYVWCQAFGNVLYKSKDDVQLNDPERGVAEVAALLETQSVVLLCVCPTIACHRTVAARLLRERLGVESVELDDALAALAPQQVPLFGQEEA